MNKLSDQQKIVRSHFELSQHTFFKVLAEAIQRKLGESTTVPTQLIGKVTAGHKMSAAIIGHKTSTDLKEHEETKERIRRLMDDLKNPSNLVGLLRE